MDFFKAQEMQQVHPKDIKHTDTNLQAGHSKPLGHADAAVANHKWI